MDKIVNVIGLGYIGLPTALSLAAGGIKVIGTDNDSQKIKELLANNIYFREEGLDELFVKAKEFHIEYSNSPVTADIYIIAVPTPYNKKNRKIISDYLVKSVNEILSYTKKDSIIVVESTVSPGTIDSFVRPLVKEENSKNKKNIEIVHAPERIIPGKMLEELKNNSRVIGSDKTEIGKEIENLYRVFCKGTIVHTNIRTAELAKVAENTYRDINIAYANELVKICREADINIYELIKIANMHPRVNILQPGPGVGGHCISVDPWFLVGDYPEIANLILTARKVNDSMPEYVLKLISEIMRKEHIDSMADVGLYGLTYKENVNDVRESPTLQLLACMNSYGVKGAKVYDPFVDNNIVDYQMHNLEQFVNSVKLVVVLVGHDEIIRQQELLKEHIVLDTRNVLSIENRYTL